MDESLILNVANRARVPIAQDRGSTMQTRLLEACYGDEEVFLDVIDATLSLARSGSSALRDALVSANSVWTVSSTGVTLERRVDPAAVDLMEAATSPTDLASEELKQAWANAYSRTPDASDAWDHSIKAMEAVLIPLVVPLQDKPTLGHVTGQLRIQATKWRLTLPGPGATP